MRAARKDPFVCVLVPEHPAVARPAVARAHVNSPFPRNPLAPAERVIPAAAAAAAANPARPPCLLNVFGTRPDGSPKYKVNACVSLHPQ